MRPMLGARIANQASRESRIAVADWVIDNSGDLTALNHNLDQAWKWITSLPHRVTFVDTCTPASDGKDRR